VPRRERLGQPEQISLKPTRFSRSSPWHPLRCAMDRPARRADVTMPANRIAPFLPLFRGGRYLWPIGKLVARAFATAACRPVNAGRRRPYSHFAPMVSANPFGSSLFSIHHLLV
jgi:hypothetical protein